MKIMIFANTDGNLSLLSDAMLNAPDDISMALCAGNLPIMDRKTEVNSFYKDKNIAEGNAAQSFFYGEEALWKPRALPKFTYAMFGSTDDPFAKANDSFANVVPIAHYWILNMIGHAGKVIADVNIPYSKQVKVGFLGGYYSPDYWADINESRISGHRHKKSLALCAHDFKEFEGKNLDFLITFESPHKYDGMHRLHGGLEKITELVKTTRPLVHFHAHLRAPVHGYINDTLSIGIPALKHGYYILDLYSGQIERVIVPLADSGEKRHILKNTKRSL